MTFHKIISSYNIWLSSDEGERSQGGEGGSTPQSERVFKIPVRIGLRKDCIRLYTRFSIILSKTIGCDIGR